MKCPHCGETVEVSPDEEHVPQDYVDLRVALTMAGVRVEGLLEKLTGESTMPQDLWSELVAKDAALVAELVDSRVETLDTEFERFQGYIPRPDDDVRGFQ